MSILKALTSVLAGGLLAVCFSSSAVAAEGKWTAGFGQGNFEYFIDAQGMTLRIGCPTSNGSADVPSSVTLENTKTGKPVTKFTVKAGGTVYQGPFEANSRVGEQNFLDLLDNLRKSDAVVAYGSSSVTFPKSNAGTVLPKWGTKTFACNLV